LDALRKKRVSPQLGDHFFNDAKYTFRRMTGLRSLSGSGWHDLHPRREADISEWITVQGLDENGISRQVLANFAKSYVIWIDHYQIPDLQPIKSWTIGQGQDSFLFYSPSTGKVYFAQTEGNQSYLSLTEIDTDGKPIIWFGQNENENTMDIILEGAEDIFTIDQYGTVLPIRKAVHGGEFSEYVLASESTDTTTVATTP
jgi:hypothetical protein